jgi:hypothetical protein
MVRDCTAFAIWWRRSTDRSKLMSSPSAVKGLNGLCCRYVVALVIVSLLLTTCDAQGPTGGATEVPTVNNTPIFVNTVRKHPLGQPVGPTVLPESLFASPYTGTYRFLIPDSAAAILDTAWLTGFDLFVNLAGLPDNYRNSDGTFCLSCFMGRLDEYASVGFAPYVASGTLRGHIMFEDADDPAQWGGEPIPLTDIAAAATYSKSLFPSVDVGVGASAAYLDQGGPWSDLRFVLSKYTTDSGSFGAWREQVRALAEKNSLSTIYYFDAQTANGGGPITAQQIYAWGKSVACYPSTRGILFGPYEPSIFDDPEVEASINSIVQLLFLVSVGGQPADVICRSNRFIE